MPYQKTKLSIILPTFNGGVALKKNLARFVNECNNKKFKNLIELCVSDNCSTDNSQKIILKYKKILNKNKYIRINFNKNNKNLGFAKNLMCAIEISKGEYLMPICDDSFPMKKFYVEIINFLKKNEFNELGYVPVNTTTKFTKKLFNINKLSYVVNRGSILSGAIFKKKNFNSKLYKPNIYLHNIFYIDIFLKFGLKQIPLNSEIKIDGGPAQKIKDKFNDRIGRKTDYGVLEKIETIDLFYRKNRLNFFQFLFAISAIYSWSVEINILLQHEGYLNLSKQYFRETLKYDNKKIIFLSFIIIIIKNLFSRKLFFIIKLFYSLLINKQYI
jgi:glycosyltransferase involved in cell wall biosynthesis